MPDDKDEVSTIIQEIDRHASNNSDQHVTPRRRPWWALGGQDLSFATARPETSTEHPPTSKGEAHVAENNIQQSVIADSQAAEFYEPIEKYEGRHRFDPNATWSEEEERKLVRRVSTSI